VEGLSIEEQKEMLKKLEAQLELNEHGQLAEAQKQKANLNQRLAARRAKNAKNKKGKEKKEEQKQVEAAKEKEKEKNMEQSLKGMFERKSTLILQDHDNDNSELMKRLRAWK
jgi:hypothetical protein